MTQQDQPNDAPYLTIVLPAYNEEDRLPASLERVVAFAGTQAYRTEIVVADDGSRDRTPGIVRERAASALPPGVTMRLVQNERNLGKGGAIRTGCLSATGQHVFFMDADLASPPEELPRLLDALTRDGCGVVIGSRIQPDGTDMRASQPMQRRIVGKVFTVVRKTLRILPDIDDTQCPIKGFQRDAVQDVFREQALAGWTFDAEVLTIARRRGYKIVSVPVHWRHVEGSRLRVRPSQAFEVLRDLLRLRLRYR